MSAGFVLPTLIGVALIALMGRVEWRLRPSLSIPLLTAAMVAATGAVTLIVAATALGFLLGPARSSALVEWCRAIPLHHEVGPVVGTIALMALAATMFRCGRIMLARRQAVHSVRRSGRLEIVESKRCFAYAVPTRVGCVVVSTGLLAPLSTDERRAVFAHERAHLRLGHHRYLLAVELSQAVLPFLKPLGAQVRHATERAADEAAASVVADRHVVARAISAVALAPGFAAVPSLGGGSVTRRVEALLWPHRELTAPAPVVAAAFAGVFAITAAVGVQLHHFASLADHLCHGVA
jgi:Zn-dependent protease with chaperone function